MDLAHRLGSQVLLVCVLTSVGYAQEAPFRVDVVQPLIDAFKAGDREKIAEMVWYPLERRFPIPPIRNKEEMLRRFDELFSPDHSRQIAESAPTRDWELHMMYGVFFKGFSMHTGHDGRIAGVGLNTEAEKRLMARILSHQKKTLHPSLAKFDGVHLEWQTRSYRLRVDYIGDKPRFAA